MVNKTIEFSNDVANRMFIELFWLPPRDSKPDKQIQNLLSYR